MGNTDSSEITLQPKIHIIQRFPSGQFEIQSEQQQFTSISQQINKLAKNKNFEASKCKFQDHMIKSAPVESFKIQFKSLDLSNDLDMAQKQNKRRFSHNPPKTIQNLFQLNNNISDNTAVDSLDFLKFIKEECAFDYYGVLQKIKTGQRGQIYKVKELETSNIKIMKIISKVSFRERNLIKGISQIQNLLKLQHPRIVKLLQAYEDINRFYIIFEKIEGSSLLEYVKRNKITEEVGKQIIKQLLEALQYIHNNGIIHRNIKLENIMVYHSEHETSAKIRLIDFGLSLTIEEALKEKHTYGSIYYAAPESLDHKINPKYDIWSVGILTLLLFLSSDPSHFRNNNYLQEILKRGQFFRQHIKKLPLKIKQFVFQLLTLKNKRRPNATEALKIEWISGKKGLYKSRIRKGVNIDQELSNRT